MSILKVKDKDGNWYNTPIVGSQGATFTPAVDSNGNLSWTNDRSLPNPAAVNIKGPKGDKGDPPASVSGLTLAIDHTFDGTEETNDASIIFTAEEYPILKSFNNMIYVYVSSTEPTIDLKNLWREVRRNNVIVTRPNNMTATPYAAYFASKINGLWYQGYNGISGDGHLWDPFNTFGPFERYFLDAQHPIFDDNKPCESVTIYRISDLVESKANVKIYVA